MLNSHSTKDLLYRREFRRGLHIYCENTHLKSKNAPHFHFGSNNSTKINSSPINLTSPNF
jgi:hypothetical protein